MSVFELKDISYSYPNNAVALDRVSLDIREGESVSIIGTNGSGKSTLLYILNGLLKPSSGAVSAFGKEIKNGYPPELRQRVSLLFQNSQAQLFSLSVRDELLFGPLRLGMSAKEAGERAESVIDMLGIGQLGERGPWDLSGGEMKKVALGACLSINPEVLLLDEPTSGLDPRSQVEITDLIVGLREAGKTIITATHDLHIIEDISERTIVMGEDHRALTEGNPWAVIEDHESLLRANLIHSHAHRHSWYEHNHSHYGAHGHEHIDEFELRPELKEEGLDKEEINKLRLLLKEWEEHNAEHSKAYLEWAGKAEGMGRRELAAALREIAERTNGLHGLFMRAKKL